MRSLAEKRSFSYSWSSSPPFSDQRLVISLPDLANDLDDLLDSVMKADDLLDLASDLTSPVVLEA